jgi:hypothetical protein
VSVVGAELPRFSIRFSIRDDKGDNEYDDIRGNHRTQRPNKVGVTHKLPSTLSLLLRVRASSPCRLYGKLRLSPFLVPLYPESVAPSIMRIGALRLRGWRGQSSR